MGCPTRSHCFRKAWCYFGGECGWLSSMVFGLSAFGMPSTAFTPENLTQTCVFRKGSKHLIIFWDLYYLSFLTRSFFRQKKCWVWPSQGSMGLTASRKLKALSTGLRMSRESADGKQFSVRTLQTFKARRVTKTNAHWLWLTGGRIELNEQEAPCLFWQQLTEKNPIGITMA